MVFAHNRLYILLHEADDARATHSSQVCHTFSEMPNICLIGFQPRGVRSAKSENWRPATTTLLKLSVLNPVETHHLSPCLFKISFLYNTTIKFTQRYVGHPEATDLEERHASQKKIYPFTTLNFPSYIIWQLNLV